VNKKTGEEVRPIFETFCDICGAPSECTCRTCALDICSDCMVFEYDTQKFCTACPPELIELQKEIEVIVKKRNDEEQPIRERMFELKRDQLKKYRKKDKGQED